MLLPGERVSAWRVTGPLGTGAMGQVFRAVVTQGVKPTAEPTAEPAAVAIKVLHPSFLDCPEVIARFRNEARAAQAAAHPGIVTVLYSGELPIGLPYFVMDLLGESLALRLRASGPLAPREACRLGAQLADALGAAHAQGIVHRDLKPGNVLFCDGPGPDRGRVKVTDFGLAKVAAAVQGERKEVSTADAAEIGTPAYCAPEQWRYPARVDGRADVYSLGVLLYEALCGRPPFGATEYAEIMRMHLYQTPPPLPAGFALSKGPGACLRALIPAMLEKDPARRPAMTAIATALAAQEE